MDCPYSPLQAGMASHSTPSMTSLFVEKKEIGGYPLNGDLSPKQTDCWAGIWTEATVRFSENHELYPRSLPASHHPHPHTTWKLSKMVNQAKADPRRSRSNRASGNSRPWTGPEAKDYFQAVFRGILKILSNSVWITEYSLRWVRVAGLRLTSQHQDMKMSRARKTEQTRVL